MENIHLAQELMRQYNRKRVAPRCLLKIDLKKAYGLVSRDFIKGVLEGLHFFPRFVKWVMECVTSPTYSVALNGSMHGFFKGGKGVRQGNVTSVQILMDCLSNFGLVSGLRLNVLKSNLYTTGINGQALEDILQITNILRGTLISVLGIALHFLMRAKWNLLGRFFKALNVFDFLSSLSQLQLSQGLLAFVENFFGDLRSLWWVERSLPPKRLRRPRLEGLEEKDHSPLFKELLEIKDLLLHKVAGPQFLAHGRAVIPVPMDSENNLTVSADLASIQQAVHTQIRGQFQVNLDSFMG
ncbi:uncharacterized protein LOC111366583 [Olea europaea var. sylvestris]|uniref:uncharacterized protein LOC111366583 n=1 Tax=Olea europaea var. sylvestris TaxID=158386 RepID=UPI000C1D1094|nr:uncharacterized protein LOC111366583 [Olea europaea var. sylvestris]